VKKLNLSEASRPLSEYAAELDEETIVITSGGKPIAAVIPLKNMESLDQESLALSTNRVFLEIIEDARAEIKGGRTLSLEEMRRAVLP
jgi:prevent-host-death family protein